MWIFLLCLFARGELVDLLDGFDRFDSIYAGTISGQFETEFDARAYSGVIYVDPPESVISVTYQQQLVAMGPSRIIIQDAECFSPCLFNVNITGTSNFSVYGYLARQVRVNSPFPFNVEMEAMTSRFFGFDFTKISDFKSRTNVIQIVSTLSMFVTVYDSLVKEEDNVKYYNITTGNFAYMVENPDEFIVVKIKSGNSTGKSFSAGISASSESSTSSAVTPSNGNLALYGSLGIASLLFAAGIVFSICFIVLKHRMSRNNNDDVELMRPKLPEVNLDKIEIAKVEDREFSSDEDARCVICLENYSKGEDLRVLQCGHHFHQECADEWFQVKAICPLCLQYLAYATDYRCTNSEDDEHGENSRIDIGELSHVQDEEKEEEGRNNEIDRIPQEERNNRGILRLNFQRSSDSVQCEDREELEA